MAEILGSSYRSQAEERMRENARNATARLVEQRKEEERQRREREAQERQQSDAFFAEQEALFPPEKGVLSEQERFERGYPITQEEVVGGYLSSPRLREYTSQLPSERMVEESEETSQQRFSPVPPPPTSVGGFLTQPIAFAFNQYELNKKAAESGDKPYEDQIRETIFGSGREEYGHPEPGAAKKGLLEKPPHPTFRREYVNAYNEFSNQIREGQFIPRGVDVREFDVALDEAEQALLARLNRRAQGFLYTFVLGGNPTRRYIPAQEMLDAYNNGRPDEFNKFVRELARIQARRQAKADFYQVFGAQEDEVEYLQRERDRAAKRAAERRSLR